MRKRGNGGTARLACALAGLAILAACAAGLPGRLPNRHCLDLSQQGMPMCSQCHAPMKGSEPFRAMDHTPLFASGHGAAVRSRSEVCSMCHAPSHCGECHGVHLELTPSQKDPGAVWRNNPHPGDYVTRHRLDAAVNPVPCQKCHGNPRSSGTCVPCHGE